MKRRDFIQTAALGAAIAGTFSGTAQAAVPQPAPATPARGGAFPKDFWWGTATAAYQLEGGATADGRKPSIWDTFSHTPGKVKEGHTGDVACDHYHRFKEDVGWMADLGVKHYRFSISWPRVLPDGRGAVNEKGIDFYKRLAEALLEKGITPHATLYHWDLPQALEDRYKGWQSREVVADFGNYASVVAKRLGDRVRHFMTLNEIGTFVHYCGYGLRKPNEHAPGLALPTQKALWQASHHALLAHGTAVLAIRAAAPGSSVGLAENFESFVPVMETPEHIDAAYKAFTQTPINGAIITPLLTGRYDPKWLEEQGSQAPEIREGDMKLIHQPLDALGFNCYTGNYVRATGTGKGFEVLPMFDNFPKLSMPWLNCVPESIYWGVRCVSDVLGQKKLPIFISENGCADGTVPNAAGEVLDIDRLMYLRAYLGQLHRALAEGYPVVGYFPWSLLDNFEWAWGYTRRFGLIYVDYKTQKRTPKLSYKWYQQVIKSGRVV